jgi:hypothetical protein
MELSLGCAIPGTIHPSRASTPFLHNRRHMSMLKWKRGEFVVRGDLMTRTMFEFWIGEDGRAALREAKRRTPNRWLFGDRRARRLLHSEARTAFGPRGTFAGMLKKQVDQLPLLVRGCAIIIRRSGYQTLNTIDGNRGLCVVPRGVLIKDFKAQLLRELVDLPQVRAFSGLTERVISAAASEAEALLFDALTKSVPLVDSSGRGLIIAVDREFRWKINGTDGHYYYAYSTEEGIDLAAKKESKRFVASMQESLKGQSVYLKRLTGAEVADIAEALQLRRMLEATTETAGGRVRSRVGTDARNELVFDAN